MQRYDYIQRAIEQLAAALARIAGFKAEGQHEKALAEVQRAYSGLDLNPHLIKLLDPTSLTQLVREPQKAAAVARLLKEEADLRDLVGHRGTAWARRRQALALCKSIGQVPEGSEVAELVEELEAALG